MAKNLILIAPTIPVLWYIAWKCYFLPRIPLIDRGFGMGMFLMLGWIISISLGTILTGIGSSLLGYNLYYKKDYNLGNVILFILGSIIFLLGFTLIVLFLTS